MDFFIGQVRVAATGRHRIETVKSVIQQGVEALGGAFGPGRFVAALGCAGDAGIVAGHADAAVDGFAIDATARRCGVTAA